VIDEVPSSYTGARAAQLNRYAASLPTFSQTMWFAALLGVAAVIGVSVATSASCGIGLLAGTSTWCGLPLFWMVGWPIAGIAAVVLGLPIYLAFRCLGLVRWWQFALGGAFLAVPFWYLLAQPFSSTRWASSGLYDSLNYLGSGSLAGFAFWWLSGRLPKPSA
jgi:hypothetical protein